MIRAPVVNTLVNGLKSVQQIISRRNAFLEAVETAYPTVRPAGAAGGGLPSASRSPPRKALNLRDFSSSLIWQRACKSVLRGLSDCLKKEDKEGAQTKVLHFTLLQHLGAVMRHLGAQFIPLAAIRGRNIDREYEVLLQQGYDKGLIEPGKTVGLDTDALLAIKVRESAADLVTRERKALYYLQQALSSAHAGLGSLDLTDEDLLGMSEQMKSIWASHAGSAAVWQKTKYKVPTSRDSYQKICSFCHNPATRRKIFEEHFRAFDGKLDALVLEVLRARQEMAKTYGMRSYADHALRDQLVGNGAGARQLMDRCWSEARGTLTPYVKRMEELLAAQDSASARSAPGKRKKKAVITQVDEAFLKALITKETQQWKLAEFFPITCIPKLLEVLGQAYGVNLKEVPGNDFISRLSNGWHKSVTILEVSDAVRGGGLLGYIYLDLYKRSSVVEFPGAFSICPGHIGISMSLESPGTGQNKLFAPDEVIAISHEMGHAIHMLCFGGVQQDFDELPMDVRELPSTLLESIILQPSAMAQFATHWQSGASPTEALVQSCQRDAYFFVNYLRSASVALALHDESFNAATATPADVRRVALAAWQRYSPVEADPIFSPFGEDAGPYVIAGPNQIAYMSCYLRVDGILFGQKQNPAKRKSIPAQQWLNPDFANRIRSQLLDRTFPNRLAAVTPTLGFASASKPPPHPLPPISGGVAAAVFGRVKQLDA